MIMHDYWILNLGEFSLITGKQTYQDAKWNVFDWWERVCLPM